MFLRAEAIDAPADWDGFSALLADLLEHEYEHRVSSRDRRRFMDALWTLSARIEPRNDEARFWRQELRNLAWTARNAWAFEGRDEGMGCNLVWLANELYPRKRIVVWSHNFHIVRDARVLDPHHLPYAVEREKYRDTPMGEIAARHLGYGLRSIAIVAGQGWYAPYAFNGDHDTRADLCAPPLGGLEDHLLRHGHELAFIDMRDATTGAFTMSGVEHDTPIEAPWHRIYDGVLYLRTMYGPAGIGVARATASAKESAISRRA